jgi:hypothetical protein
MEKHLYTVQFTNGAERRSTVFLQPDMIFAAMAGQRCAPEVFAQPWNRVMDRSEWKIVVVAPDGRRYEEAARAN